MDVDADADVAGANAAVVAVDGVCVLNFFLELTMALYHFAGCYCLKFCRFRQNY